MLLCPACIDELVGLLLLLFKCASQMKSHNCCHCSSHFDFNLPKGYSWESLREKTISGKLKLRWQGEVWLLLVFHFPGSFQVYRSTILMFYLCSPVSARERMNDHVCCAVTFCTFCSSAVAWNWNITELQITYRCVTTLRRLHLSHTNDS